MISLLFFLSVATLSVVIYAQHVSHIEQLAEAAADKQRIIAAWQQHCEQLKRVAAVHVPSHVPCPDLHEKTVEVSPGHCITRNAFGEVLSETHATTDTTAGSAPVQKRQVRRHITADQADRCRSLREQGQTIRAIAWVLQLSEKQVRRALRTAPAEVTHRPAPAKGGPHDVTTSR